MGTLTVYRSRSVFWAFRQMTVLIDGESAGTVKRKQRLSVQVPDGSHRLAARIGTTTSRPLTVEIDEAGAILAIRIVAPADRQQAGQPDYLQLVRVDDFDDRGASYREMYRNRPPIGYRRLRSWERPVWAIALVVAVAGRLLHHLLGSALSVAIGGPAVLVLLVLAVRLFLYRPDN